MEQQEGSRILVYIDLIADFGGVVKPVTRFEGNIYAYLSLPVDDSRYVLFSETPARGKIDLGYIDPETREFLTLGKFPKCVGNYKRFNEGNNKQINQIFVPPHLKGCLKTIPSNKFDDPTRISFESIDDILGEVIGLNNLETYRMFVPHIKDFVRYRSDGG